MTLQKTNDYILYELKENTPTSDVKEQHKYKRHYQNYTHNCLLQYRRKVLRRHLGNTVKKMVGMQKYQHD